MGIFGCNGHFLCVPMYFKSIFQIFGKTQIWQFNHFSLWDLFCWLISVDFRVTPLMPTSFVVCRQNFGELSLLRCPSPKKPQIQPRRQKMALSRKVEAFKVFSRYVFDLSPQNWVCLDLKNGGIEGVA